MTNPLVVSFTFKDTPSVTAIDAFGASITSTPWFAQVTKDYCVPDGGPCIGGGTAGIAVAIPTNADATYVETGATASPAGCSREPRSGRGTTRRSARLRPCRAPASRL